MVKVRCMCQLPFTRFSSHSHRPQTSHSEPSPILLRCLASSRRFSCRGRAPGFSWLAGTCSRCRRGARRSRRRQRAPDTRRTSGSSWRRQTRAFPISWWLAACSVLLMCYFLTHSLSICTFPSNYLFFRSYYYYEP